MRTNPSRGPRRIRELLLEYYRAVTMREHLLVQMRAHRLGQHHHFEILALAGQVGERVADWMRAKV